MSDTVNLSFPLSDNGRLSNLCGVMDGNIEHIASAYEVDIRRRGGQFSVRGKSAQAAADTLEKLYARAAQNIDLVDVQLCMAAADNETPPAPKKRPRLSATRNTSQEDFMQKILSHSVTICTGPAGTGKTHIAIAAALHLLWQDASLRLVLTRPAVEAGGERIGFLPGDMEQKVNPYLRPLHDILHKLLGYKETERQVARGRIEIIPLAFMRGLTIDNAVIILDEAQNTTPVQMKMALTRLGTSGRFVITGDTSQSDLPTANGGGLADAKRRLHDIKGIAMHHFTVADVVRHPLVRKILSAYENGV